MQWVRIINIYPGNKPLSASKWLLENLVFYSREVDRAILYSLKFGNSSSYNTDREERENAVETVCVCVCVVETEDSK